MNIDLIFKIGAIGIFIAILNIVLGKAGRDDYAMMATLAGVVLVLMMVLKEINTLFNAVKTMFNLY